MGGGSAPFLYHGGPCMHPSESGTRVPAANSITPNAAGNNTHYAGLCPVPSGDFPTATSGDFNATDRSRDLSNEKACEHFKLRLLIDPLKNVYQAYCRSCFFEGPKAGSQRSAVNGFWAGMVSQHFTSNGYGHAASLSGYWGPETPRYTPAQLVALGFGS